MFDFIGGRSKPKKEMEDSLDFDFDMDANFDDGLGDDSRTPIMKAVSGFRDTIENDASPSTVVESMVTSALPEHMEKSASSISGFKDEMQSEVQEILKDVKPKINQISKAVDGMVPSDGVLGKLNKNFKDFLGIEDKARRDEKKLSKDQAHDEVVASKLDKIFKGQAASGVRLATQTAVDKNVDRSIMARHSASNVAHLTGVKDSIDDLVRYNSEVTHKYQRKSLELKYKNVFLLREMLADSRKYNAIFRAQNQAIEKNTGLPEWKKKLKGELLDQLTHENIASRMSDSLVGEGSRLDTYVKNVKSYGLKKVTDLANAGKDIDTDALSSIGMMDKYNLVGTVGGSLASEAVLSRATDAIKGYKGGDNIVNRTLLKFTNAVAEAPDKIDDFVDNQSKDKITDSKPKSMWRRFISEVGTALNGEKEQIKINDNDRIYEFDRKVYNSITDVMPGFLSRILQELQITRTGQDVPLTSYDYSTGGFGTNRSHARRVRSILSETMDSSTTNSNLDEFIDTFDGSDAAKEAIRKIVKSNMTGVYDGEKKIETPTQLLKSVQFEELDAATKEEVSNAVKNVNASELRKNASIEALRETRMSAPDMGKLLGVLLDSYGQDVLKETGLINVDGNDVTVNREALDKYIFDKGGAIQDDISASHRTFRDGAFRESSIDPDIQSGYSVEPDMRKIVTGLDRLVECACGERGDIETKDGTKAGTQQVHDALLYEFLVKAHDQNRSDRANISSKMMEEMHAAAASVSLNIFGSGGKGDGGDGVVKRTFDDLFDKGGTLLSGTKNTVMGIADGIGNSVKSIFTGTMKGPEKLAGLAGKGITSTFDLGGRILGSGVKLIENVFGSAGGAISDIISSLPKPVLALMDAGVWLKDKVVGSIDGFINAPCDVYTPSMPDGPVLFKMVMKIGGYFDAKTGEPIRSPKDIAGAVVDGEGNVVLSTEMLQDGLFDKNGNDLTSKLGRVSATARRVIGWGADKAIGMKKSAKEKVKDLRKKIPETLLEFQSKRGSDSLAEIRKMMTRSPMFRGSNEKRVRNDRNKDGIRDGSFREKRESRKGQLGTNKSEGKLTDKESTWFRNIVAPMFTIAGGLLTGIAAISTIGFGAIKTALAVVPALFSGISTITKLMTAAKAGGMVKGAFDWLTNSGTEVDPDDKSGRKRKKKHGIASKLLGSKFKWLKGLGKLKKGGALAGFKTKASGGFGKAKDFIGSKVGTSGNMVNMNNLGIGAALAATSGMAGGGMFGDLGLDTSYDSFVKTRDGANEEEEMSRLLANEPIDDRSFSQKAMGVTLEEHIKAKEIAEKERKEKSTFAFNKDEGISTEEDKLRRRAKTETIREYDEDTRTGFWSYLHKPLEWTAGMVSFGYSDDLMKYMYGNKVDVTNRDGLRMLQYGFFKEDTIAIKRCRYLEIYLRDKGYIKGGKSADITVGNDTDAFKEMADLCNVDIDSKKEIDTFWAWFIKRFIPTFKRSLAALGYLGKSKGDIMELRELTDEEFRVYLQLSRCPTCKMGKMLAPFQDLQSTLDVTNGDILRYVETFGFSKGEAEAAESVMSSSNILIPTDKARGRSHSGMNRKYDPREVITGRMKDAQYKDKKFDNHSGRNKYIDPKLKLEAETIGKILKPKDYRLATMVVDSDIAGGPLYDGTASSYIVLENDITGAPKIEMLNSKVLELLYGMANEYGTVTGKRIIVHSAYRTYADQVTIHTKYREDSSAPGTSIHELGLAFDIKGDTAKDLDRLGLLGKYGFTCPIGKTPWHIEPVGIQLDLGRIISDPEFDPTVYIIKGIGHGGGGYGLGSNANKGMRSKAAAQSLLLGSRTVNKRLLPKSEIESVQSREEKARKLRTVSSGAIGKPGSKGSTLKETIESRLETDRKVAAGNEGKTLSQRLREELAGAQGMTVEEVDAARKKYDSKNLKEYKARMARYQEAIKADAVPSASDFTSGGSDSVVGPTRPPLQSTPVVANTRSSVVPEATPRNTPMVANPVPPAVPGYRNRLKKSSPTMEENAKQYTGEPSPRRPTRTYVTPEGYNETADPTDSTSTGENTSPRARRKSKGFPKLDKSMVIDKRGNYSLESMREAVNYGARTIGIDPDILQTIIAQESGFRNVPNPRSKDVTKAKGARGLGQFIPGTWEQMHTRYGKKYGIDPKANRYDPKASSVFSAAYVKEGLDAAKKRKGFATPADGYMYYFMGPGGNNKMNSLMASNPDALTVKSWPKFKIWSKHPANKFYFYHKDGTPKTVKETYASFNEKLNNRAREFGVTMPEPDYTPVGSRFKSKSEEPKPTTAAEAAANVLKKKTKVVDGVLNAKKDTPIEPKPEVKQGEGPSAEGATGEMGSGGATGVEVESDGKEQKPRPQLNNLVAEASSENTNDPDGSHGRISKSKPKFRMPFIDTTKDKPPRPDIIETEAPDEMDRQSNLDMSPVSTLAGNSIQEKAQLETVSALKSSNATANSSLSALEQIKSLLGQILEKGGMGGSTDSDGNSYDTPGKGETYKGDNNLVKGGQNNFQTGENPKAGMRSTILPNDSTGMIAP